MELDLKYVGTILKPYKTRVTWRQTTNYAASIKDSNPYYFDDEQKGGLVAHPLFPVVVNWPIIENISEFIIDQNFPQHFLARGVHYSEHIIVHRLIKPKDRLQIEGQIAAIKPHRAGSHFIGEFKATDRKGYRVFTEYTGIMLRGVKCSPEGAEISNLPTMPSYLDNKWQGKPEWVEDIFIDLCLPYVYDGCTNIVFPIHTSPKFAHSVKLPGNILQGTATLAIAVSSIINRESGGNPSNVKEIYCQFTGMVLPGTEIKLQVLKKIVNENEITIYFNVVNHIEKKAISNGVLKLNNV
ncbi:hypothetical protein NEF87_000703 [Candidatus Lokiarchaeum ossiferum]|uniref:MaoC-like domain-containing protein n=1 Tax=Candidatus Lokiarchaeum ossiferum TaxID=2951803 RepID=A0ABY6HM86_9ARCH|nr:hypothetical protein NEF87_000703 [Candidatus Lokiarchaeum sp. B-35]